MFVNGALLVIEVMDTGQLRIINVTGGFAATGQLKVDGTFSARSDDGSVNYGGRIDPETGSFGATLFLISADSCVTSWTFSSIIDLGVGSVVE